MERLFARIDDEFEGCWGALGSDGREEAEGNERDDRDENIEPACW
jgi:hypothetical protein